MSEVAAPTSVGRQKLMDDKALNRQLDRVSESLELNVPRQVKSLKAPKRKVGRPRNGRVVFDQVRIDQIPDIGYCSDVAKALGVKRISVQKWCDLKRDALPMVEDNGHYVLRRDVVIKWLIKTRRFAPKP